MKLLLIALLALNTNLLFAQEVITYKKAGTITLTMKVYKPADFDQVKKHGAIVFFFGGGWRIRQMNQFVPQATYFAKKGLVCFLADYRVSSTDHSTPFESLMDAKSAIRFIKEHATQFHVDSSRIIASGGSAGGQLAAATALIDDYNDRTDNLQISCRPEALVLFNPVIDNGPGGFGYSIVGEAYLNFSPLHNIRKGAPPTLFMLGRQDIHIPVVTAEYYKMVMEKVGSRCDLKLYDHAGHGFFNYSNGKNKFYDATLGDAEAFLTSLGYIKADKDQQAIK